MRRALSVFERPALNRLVWILTYIVGGLPAIILTILRQQVWAIVAFVGYIGITVLGDRILRSHLAKNKHRLRLLTRTISDFIMQYKAPYHIKKCVFIYEVGLFARGDRRRREYSIEAYGDQEEKVVVKGLDFGAGGENVPGQSSLDDLHLTCKISKGEGSLIPREESDPHRQSAFLLFDPPIKPGETRDFTIEGQWEGEWNPLREEGADWGEVDFRHRTADNLEIVVVFPKGIRENDVTFERRAPHDKTGEVSPEYERGQLHIIWKILRPKQTAYQFDVYCKKLSKRRIRLRLWIKSAFSI